MILLEAKVPKTWNLYLLSDFHVGSIMHHKSGLVDTIAKIKRDKLAKVCILGDLMESILIDDKRFQLDTVDPDASVPMQQIEYLIALLEPIKDKIVCINDGNHELKNRKFGVLIEYLCNRLGIAHTYGTYSSKITFKNEDGTNQFKIFVTHGSRSMTTNADDPIRQESNLKLRLKKLLAKKAADCLIMARGHSHKLILAEPEKTLYLTDDGERIHEHYTKSKDVSGGGYIHPDHRWYACTGSFYKLYGDMGVSGYAERAEYDPHELGYIKFKVRNGEIVRGERVIV